MRRSAGYVDAESLKRIAVVLHDLKQRSYTAMHVQPGSHVLDLGCGPGIDTIPLGHLVGPTGSVLGVDLDEDMIAQARRLAAEAQVSAWVSHQQGDVQALPFDDATFDACHADRLFQVLPATINPQRVCAEVLRVLKPSGWFVAADADWGTWSLDSDEVELERKVARFLADGRPNGYAGRQLRRLFTRAGLEELRVEIHPTQYARAVYSPLGGDSLARAALAAGVLTPDEYERWQASVAAAEASNEFFALSCMVLVAGRKP